MLSSLSHLRESPCCVAPAGRSSAHPSDKLPCWSSGAPAGGQPHQAACDTQDEHQGGPSIRALDTHCPGVWDTQLLLAGAAGPQPHRLCLHSGTAIPINAACGSKAAAHAGLTLTKLICSPDWLQVNKANEEQRLDHQRMLLSVNHKGVILGVNPGGLDKMVSNPKKSHMDMSFYLPSTMTAVDLQWLM